MLAIVGKAVATMLVLKQIRVFNNALANLAVGFNHDEF